MRMRAWGCVLALSALTAGLAAAAPRLCWEAESASQLEAPVRRVCATNLPPGGVWLSDASAGGYLEIPEGSGNPPERNAGRAVFAVDVPAEAAYTLWLRVYWEGECSNSFSLQVDGAAPLLLGEDGTYKAWHWVKYPVSRLGPPLRLTAGAHVLTFLNREDGVRLDQVALSADARWVPVGVEKTTGQPAP